MNVQFTQQGKGVQLTFGHSIWNLKKDQPSGFLLVLLFYFKYKKIQNAAELKFFGALLSDNKFLRKNSFAIFLEQLYLCMNISKQ